MKVVDLFTAPEVFATRIGRIEAMPGNCARVYLCCEKDGALVVQVMVMMPIECLAKVGRDCLSLAAQAHNDVALGVIH